MNEMTVIVTKEVFLNVCISIEGLCAELYHHYSTVFEDIPAAALLWKKTAQEEENHQKQFELALRLVTETEFELSKDSLKRAYSAHNELLKLLSQTRDNKPGLLLAVSKALELEEKLASLHAHSALLFREESMQNLFKALSEADSGHVADMQRYRTTLQLKLCETNN